jgi:hypothetical protein
MRSLRSHFNRAGPDGREVDLARAVAIEVLRTVDRVERRAYERGLADAQSGSSSARREEETPLSGGSLAPRPPRR